MKKLLAMILGGTGAVMTSLSESSCAAGWFDEPEMSKNMIER